jgi:hypothetical protein
MPHRFGRRPLRISCSKSLVLQLPDPNMRAVGVRVTITRYAQLNVYHLFNLPTNISLQEPLPLINRSPFPAPFLACRRIPNHSQCADLVLMNYESQDRIIFIFNPSRPLTLQTARNLNVACPSKRSKALLS